MDGSLDTGLKSVSLSLLFGLLGSILGSLLSSEFNSELGNCRGLGTRYGLSIDSSSLDEGGVLGINFLGLGFSSFLLEFDLGKTILHIFFSTGRLGGKRSHLDTVVLAGLSETLEEDLDEEGAGVLSMETEHLEESPPEEWLREFSLEGLSQLSDELGQPPIEFSEGLSLILLV